MIKKGQLRRWLTTKKMILIIHSVPGTSNWMVLKSTSGIDYLSENILDHHTEVISETR